MRRLLAWVVAGLGVLASLPMLHRARYVEPDTLIVTEAEIRLPRWPPALDGFRIVAISDIHTGAPFVDVAKLRTLVALANAQQPDLVVLLGDYVIHGVPGGRFVAPEVTAAELRGLRARLGVFAVLGNHDNWLDGRRVARALEGAGVPVLDGRAVRLPDRGCGVSLVGIADILKEWPMARRILDEVRGPDPVVALTHNPDAFPFLPKRIDLVLAGHTHGGQVRLPLFGTTPIVPSSYGSRYARGLVVEDGRHLFVTSGVGTSVLPLRYGVPPEIALLTLKSVTP